MKKILSIQSHVAYGYVGNRAAVLPLQCMEYDVTAINTVQFSNHPGHGSWTGQVFTPDHIEKLVTGLRYLGILHTFDAVLSGYLGDAALGQIVTNTVAEIKKHNPACIYCCDPVMGDVGKGLFVKPDIPAHFRDSAVSVADILTPNLFELEQLTGMNIQSLEEVYAACQLLHMRGVETVLVTSLLHPITPPGTVQMLASQKSGQKYLVTTPYIDFQKPLGGTGDLTAALFLGNVLITGSIKSALEWTATRIFEILETTKADNAPELSIIKNIQNLVSKDIKYEKPSFLARQIS